MTQAMHTSNGQIQISSQYVIEALRQDNATLREHNLQLHAMFLQVQGEAQKEIEDLRSQLAVHENVDAPAPATSGE